jgi:hypothetical protein
LLDSQNGRKYKKEKKQKVKRQTKKEKYTYTKSDNSSPTVNSDGVGNFSQGGNLKPFT